MNHPEKSIHEGMLEGQAFGSQLVGLMGGDAAQRAKEAGFVPQLVPPDAEALTADLNADRLRLSLDWSGTVTAVEPG